MNLFTLFRPALLCPLFTAAALAAPPLDTLSLGDPASEQGHAVSAPRSEVFQGGLNEPARRLLAAAPGFESEPLAFTCKVDPEKLNYLTIRLWGGEVNPNSLVLFCEGKQIGYRHLGDIDLLDHGSDAPVLGGRFFYSTTPMPLALTRGKTSPAFQIRANGPVWGYAAKFEDYQKPMREPSRGLYRLYTGTDGFFDPPAAELQGSAPAEPTVRTAPGPEVLEAAVQRVNGALAGALLDARPLPQTQLHFLARAYAIEGTPGFENPKTVEQVVKGIDALFVRFRKEPKFATLDPGTPNPDWFGMGLAGDAVRLLAKPLAPFLDAEISDGAGAKLSRRAAWCELLEASREWNRRNRRLYTNQSMIKDLNIYRANRGIAVLVPARALAEKDALHYLYESVGLLPWLGSDTDAGPAKPLGDDYWQLTKKHLTKELGFVGYYGEVLDWMTQIYEATCEPGQPGDPKIKAQLALAARARSFFRYPAADAEGHRAMRAETVVGWRDVHFPGDITYGQRPTWDSSSVGAAAATLDADLVGAAQLMFADNQFFASLSEQLKERGPRTTAGLLGIAADYRLLSAQPPSPRRLPMAPGGPDFAWADEEDGVVAIKHGGEILYVSLYWRARHAVNFLARVHHLTPRFSRVAVLAQETQFEASGTEYKRPDWINFGFANGGPRYPEAPHSAHAGEVLPIAKIPAGIAFKAGQESIHAGKGSFYRLQYGGYLIGMNMSPEKTFELAVPGEIRSAPDLVSGRTLEIRGPLKIAPQSTVVLYLGP